MSPGPETRASLPTSRSFFVQIFCGTLPVLGKVAMREMTPFTLAAVRGAFGDLLLSLAARAFSGPAPRQTPGDRLEIAFLALFGIVANQVLFICGLHRTTATHATLLVATVPIFTIVVGLRMRRERPSARRLLGVPIAFGGVVFLLGTAGAYALNAWALARTGASTTAFFIYIQPLFAGVLACLILGETPSPRLFGAAILIFTGVAFTIWPSRTEGPAARGRSGRVRRRSLRTLHEGDNVHVRDRSSRSLVKRGIP